MTRTKIIEFASIVGAVIVGIVLYSLVARFIQPVTGGGTTNFGGDLVVDAFTANSTATITGAASLSSTLAVTGDATVSGGDLTVTTSNTATSTLIVGCIQTYATSTATAVRISATTTAAGGTALYSVFGTCPF